MHFDRLKRREFITLLGGAAGGWSLSARAQEPSRTYRIGFLVRAPRNTPFADALFDELRVNGFIDGQNLIPDCTSWRL
jgi:putative tryptophan/tyrosine transport system substrate-binding protein